MCCRIILVIYLILTFYSADAQNCYINIHGSDTATCGSSVKLPCKSIERCIRNNVAIVNILIAPGYCIQQLKLVTRMQIRSYSWIGNAYEPDIGNGFCNITVSGSISISPFIFPNETYSNPYDVILDCNMSSVTTFFTVTYL
jgi:hypothetical protein